MEASLAYTRLRRRMYTSSAPTCDFDGTGGIRRGPPPYPGGALARDGTDACGFSGRRRQGTGADERLGTAHGLRPDPSGNGRILVPHDFQLHGRRPPKPTPLVQARGKHGQWLEKGGTDRSGRGARALAEPEFLGARRARAAIGHPLRGPAALLRGVRPHQERLRRAGARRQAHQGSHQWHGPRARPALGLPRRRCLQGTADIDSGQVRRARHRGRRRGRHHQGRLPDRGHAGVSRRRSRPAT